MTRAKFLLAIAAAMLVALPATASAARGGASRTVAESALKRVKELKQGIGVRSGRELTPALAELARNRSALGPVGRQQAAAALARPTDPGESFPGHSYSVGEQTPFCTAHFCIHYVASTADAPDPTNSGGDPAPDYIESMAAVFENDVYTCENGTAAFACPEGGTGLGWPQAPSDGGLGGDAKVDVYVEQLGGTVFGYAAPEQTTHSSYGYLVMDNDYSEYGYGDPLVPLEVTAAHEYNHILQFGMDSWEDGWMFESTATWAEDKVYPSINDYLNYMPHWVQLLAQPLTEFADDNPSTPAQEDLKVYGSAVWNLWLDHRYGGDDVIQSAWSQSTALGSFAPGAYDKSIRDRAGVGFPDEFEQFAAAVAEWRAPNAGFPDLYPDVPTRPSLAVDSTAVSLQLDHTTFAFRNLAPPTNPKPMVLTATLPTGLRGAIALVGRTGSSTDAGSVTTKIASTASGGRLSVVLPDAQNFGRITAVFVNADPTVTGSWDPAIQDWHFTKDGQSFTAVRASTSAPPGVTTTPASQIGTTGATLNGSVNPIAQATTYWFEYGTSVVYGSQVPLAPADAGSGTADTPVSAAVGGLAPGTTYHYRLVAQNAGGTSYGNDQTFSTQSPPIVTTGSASAIGVDSATLNATVDPRGTPTTYVFEYGLTNTYGKKVPLTPGTAGSASQALAVATPVNGLRPGATIHFRVVATNSAGTSIGADASFKTSRLRVLAAVGTTTLKGALKRGVGTRPRCNANCSVTLQLLLPAKLAKRLHVKRVVASAKVRTGPGGRAARLRFAKKVAARLRKQRKLALSLKLTATTSAGGRATATKSVKLR